jgi:biopolymer transport protein ExbB
MTLRRLALSFSLISLLLLGLCAGVMAQEATPEAIDPMAAPVEMAETEVERTEIRGSLPLLDRFRQGGLTMVFLLALSVAAVTFTLERLFNLRRSAIYPDGLTQKAQELWSKGDFEQLNKVCEANPSTLSTTIQAFIRHRRCSAPELSTLAGDLAGRDLRAHLQRAYPLAVVATLAPLLGLLGTVIGMIESFEVVAIAGSLGDASLLASGISKALVTTALGLIVAVPALGLYHFFKSRTNTMAMGLEGEVNELLTSWFMEKSEPATTQEVLPNAR